MTTIKLIVARIELFWNNNPYLAVGLIAGAGIAAIWTGFHPQSPGSSITLLALAAGIISVRPKMHLVEKLAWVVLLTTFTYQEMKAIKQNDLDNRAIRDSQNTAFGLIVDDLKTSIQNSKDQYKQTVDHVDAVSDHVDGVATTTQKIADLARINLENVTGGSSFAYVYPSAMLGSNQQLLKIHNAGNQILSGVTLTIGEVVREDEQGCDQVMAKHTVITIGTLAPNDGRTVPNGIITPDLSANGNVKYQMYINAQNPGVSEDLQFRRSPNGVDLDFKFDVARPVVGKRLQTDVKMCGGWIRYLKRVDWRTTRFEGSLEQNTK